MKSLKIWKMDFQHKWTQHICQRKQTPDRRFIIRKLGAEWRSGSRGRDGGAGRGQKAGRAATKANSQERGLVGTLRQGSKESGHRWNRSATGHQKRKKVRQSHAGKQDNLAESECALGADKLSRLANGDRCKKSVRCGLAGSCGMSGPDYRLECDRTPHKIDLGREAREFTKGTGGELELFSTGVLLALWVWNPFLVCGGVVLLFAPGVTTTGLRK